MWLHFNTQSQFRPCSRNLHIRHNVCFPTISNSPLLSLVLIVFQKFSSSNHCDHKLAWILLESFRFIRAKMKLQMFENHRLLGSCLVANIVARLSTLIRNTVESHIQRTDLSSFRVRDELIDGWQFLSVWTMALLKGKISFYRAVKEKSTETYMAITKMREEHCSISAFNFHLQLYHIVRVSLIWN